ncbi:tail tube monomer [Acidovorax phage ACP17]|uniref:Tail tube monomer n=1 Tax=Acidovorax phage ACP17 TaxID=2010329 RepID=A0A218M2V2_9CAUD|nr:tail tube monomer [Acidovorax phage ACP17]ASD50373.1 tail tube monomer [Acidovorax phage ACP17]
MTASIADFLANFQGGGFRPNRYNVVLTYPNGVPNALAAAVKTGFTCKAASIPASSVGVVEIPYMGRNAKVPGDKTWADWTVSIFIDTDFATRDVFETWHDLILGFSNNTAAPGFANPVNAFAAAQVQALDRYDNIIKTYNVEGMWPTEVGEVTLGFDQNDQVAEMQVTFAINGWYSEATPN